MWWTLALAGLLLAGPQVPATRPVDAAPAGTLAPANYDKLPDAIVKRIRAIEARTRPESRARQMQRPGFDKVSRASVAMAVRHHNQWANLLRLDGQERSEFLAILRAGHQARLESMAYRHKQGSGYVSRIRELAEAGKLPAVLAQGDPRPTNQKLRRLLGDKRYAIFLEIGETDTGRPKRGPSR